MILTKSIIISAILISTATVPLHTHTVLITAAEPTKPSSSIVVPVKQIDPVSNTCLVINEGKAHEDCMRESLEHVYRKVNAEFSEVSKKVEIDYM